MNEAARAAQGGGSGAFDPLRVPVFRRIWTASLLSNFGQLILGVGAAWEMTRLSSSASMVALVQTALMLPLMLVAVPAGAIADMFDRRKVAIVGLGFSILAATALTVLAWAGQTSPWMLLAFCSLIGAGVALYQPSWQSSISEQVAPGQLPAAVALGTISYNLARSFGPAIGGLIVVAVGAQAAFAVNAFAYIPLLLAFLLWRRTHTPSRLPPERIGRAIVSGARFVSHSSATRALLGRSFLFGLGGATAVALAPLVARDLLGGDASVYGLLLGAGGVGAVLGALMVNQIERRLGADRATSLLSVVTGVALIAVGLSRSLPLTFLALMVAGGSHILTIALCNVSVQLSAPRWVVARAISLFTSALTGGIALGAWLWGEVANVWSVGPAMVASGVFLMLMPLVWRFLPISRAKKGAEVEPMSLSAEPEVAMPLTMRSGPVVVEVDYRVGAPSAREFYEAMQPVRRTRLRNGAFAWSIARDIGDPELWTERFHFPTWGDYLRWRDRHTLADHAAQAAADAWTDQSPKRIRRQLERPFGSVRWRADTPDPQFDGIGYIAPMA